MQNKANDAKSTFMEWMVSIEMRYQFSGFSGSKHCMSATFSKNSRFFIMFCPRFSNDRLDSNWMFDFAMWTYHVQLMQPLARHGWSSTLGKVLWAPCWLTPSSAREFLFLALIDHSLIIVTTLLKGGRGKGRNVANVLPMISVACFGVSLTTPYPLQIAFFERRNEGKRECTPYHWALCRSLGGSAGTSQHWRVRQSRSPRPPVKSILDLC